MWRPGDPKPGGGRSSPSQPTQASGGGGGSSSSSSRQAKTPPSSPQPKESSSGGRNLSSGTMSMKFMQRKAAKDAGVKEDLEKSKAECSAKWTIKRAAGGEAAANSDEGTHNGPIFETEETDPRTQWIGRRSFGGFNPIVARIWEENCEKLGLLKRSKRRSDEITDEEMVERFQRHTGKAPVNEGSTTGPSKKARYDDRVAAGPYGRRQR